MKRIRLSKRFRPFNQALLALALLLSFSALLNAQTLPTQFSRHLPQPIQRNSAESLQTRIGRARALIAAHHLDTAASELESVRAATVDSAVRNITSIMLMSVYLEEGNYGRAEALLEENYQNRSAQKDESLGTYFALAGQAVNGARLHLARYRSFGINITDANLPAEAVSDLNRLRSLLERMIVQAKEISSGRQGLRLLVIAGGRPREFACHSRKTVKIKPSGKPSTRTRGRYWLLRKHRLPRSVVFRRCGLVSLRRAISLHPRHIPPSESLRSQLRSRFQTKPTYAILAKRQAQLHLADDEPKTQSSVAKPVEPDADDAGSLNAFATRKVVPRYPPMAKQSGTAGLVRVHVIVENGKVIAVSRSEGPMLLRSAAEEAARQWSFQVVSIEGRPTRLSGYIDFTFTL